VTAFTHTHTHTHTSYKIHTLPVLGMVVLSMSPWSTNICNKANSISGSSSSS
jgi:hypothetical protein